MKGVHDDRPPEDLWHAILRLVWNRPPLQRYSLIALLVACICVFTIWSSLPTSIQERLILQASENEQSSMGTTSESATLTKRGIKPIGEHQIVDSTSEWHNYALKAAAFLDTDSEGSIEQALSNYQKALKIGGDKLKKSLNKDFLFKARAAVENGKPERAVELYRAAFTQILSENK